MYDSPHLRAPAQWREGLTKSAKAHRRQKLEARWNREWQLQEVLVERP
jgi:hypothetical protein